MASSTIYKTGHCHGGLHEGTKPRSASGTPMKTCQGFVANATLEKDAKGKLTGRRIDMKCGCDCHAMLDKMFEMAGMERVMQENPEWHEPPELAKMRACLEDIRRDSADRALQSARKDVVVVQSQMPDILPPDVVGTFSETPTGRKARGQLEDEVKKITDMWTAMNAGDLRPCTTVWIAEMINADRPPSTGAITAVLERWAAYGFATMAKKPTRFTGYTPEGIRDGLHLMKSNYKIRKRQDDDRKNRGVSR